MDLVKAGTATRVELRKDLTRSIKRGHAWLYSDAIKPVKVPAGSAVVITNQKREQVAVGIYDPQHPLPVRVCRTSPPYELDDAWMAERLQHALQLRRHVFNADTTGFRLVAGEGDGLPGLIVDVYERVAVMKLDGGAPQAFYQPPGIARWLRDSADVDCVVFRPRERGSCGEVLVGELPSREVQFLENGMNFRADVIQGQKTGFFLDQRDNRDIVRRLSCDKQVLNLFSFNGGFSIAAGCGGAAHVTSVDIAAPAIEAAGRHWVENECPGQHDGIAADCFEYLEMAISQKRRWDVVICDPPSFAPSEKTRERGLAAYAKLATLAAKVTRDQGLLALASCSSHVDAKAFSITNQEGLGRARVRGDLLSDRGLPIDHPTPAAMPELRYLKFQLMRIHH